MNGSDVSSVEHKSSISISVSGSCKVVSVEVVSVEALIVVLDGIFVQAPTSAVKAKLIRTVFFGFWPRKNLVKLSSG